MLSHTDSPKRAADWKGRAAGFASDVLAQTLGTALGAGLLLAIASLVGIANDVSETQAISLLAAVLTVATALVTVTFAWRTQQSAAEARRQQEMLEDWARRTV